MKSIAHLDKDEACQLWRLLKSEGIPAELMLNEEESGLQVCDVVVPEEYAQNACWLAEAWQKNLSPLEDARWRCPACRSYDTEVMSQDEQCIWLCTCRDCGCRFEAT